MMKKIALLTISIVLLLCNNVKASDTSVSNVKELIVRHAISLGIEPALALSIAKSESGFKHSLKSPYGAIGVFQLMPDTARRLGVNPYSLEDNIKGGLVYYKMLYNMFGSTEVALAAYNAGPVFVKRHNNTVPSATRGFVNQIMSDYRYQKRNPDPAITQLKKKNPPKYVSTVKPVVKVKPMVTVKPAILPKHTDIDITSVSLVF